jgi:hypothetical protein
MNNICIITIFYKSKSNKLPSRLNAEQNQFEKKKYIHNHRIYTQMIGAKKQRRQMAPLIVRQAR